MPCWLGEGRKGEGRKGEGRKEGRKDEETCVKFNFLHMSAATVISGQNTLTTTE